MDRIRRRQIGARPFLRPAGFFVWRRWNSNSVGFGAGERGKRHGLDFGQIHGTAAGNLFFLVHRSGEFTNFFIFCSFRSWYFFERGSNRVELGWRCKLRQYSIKYDDSPVDPEIEIGWSSLGGDFLFFNRGVSGWVQQWTLDSFHGLVVGGGHCRLTLRILFSIIPKTDRQLIVNNFIVSNILGILSSQSR